MGGRPTREQYNEAKHQTALATAKAENSQKEATNLRLERERQRQENFLKQTKHDDERKAMMQGVRAADARASAVEHQMKQVELKYDSKINENERLKGDREDLRQRLQTVEYKRESDNRSNEEKIRRHEEDAKIARRDLDRERRAHNETNARKDQEAREAQNRLDRMIAQQTAEYESHKREVVNLYEERIKDNKHYLELEQKRNLESHSLILKHMDSTTEMFCKMLQDSKEERNKQIRESQNQFSLIYGILRGTPAQNSLTDPSHSKQSPTTYCYVSNPCVFILDNVAAVDELRSFVDKDEEVLQNLFDFIEIDVEPHADGRSIIKSTGECEKKNFSANDCLIAFIFSKGTGMMLRDRNEIQVADLLRPFFKNPTLKRKPKIFFVQAIRDQHENGFGNSGLEETDYLLCYCEMNYDLYTQTHTSEGSLCIRSLCEALSSRPDEDIARVLKAVKDNLKAQANMNITFRLENKNERSVRICNNSA